MSISFKHSLARPSVTALYLKALTDSVTANNAGQYRHVLTLRLMPFEKVLIEHIHDHHGSSSEASHISESAISLLAKVIFFHWSWSAAVLRGILTELDPNRIQNVHLGSQAQSFSMFEGILRSQIVNITFGRRDMRVDSFLQDNVDFVSKATTNSEGDIDWERITIQPHEDDAWYWKVLAYLFYEHFSDVQNWSGFRAVTALLTGSNVSDSSEDDDSHLDMVPSFNDEQKMIENIVAAWKDHVTQVHEAEEGDESEQLENHTTLSMESVSHMEISATTEECAKAESEALHIMEQTAEIMVDDMKDAYDLFDIWIVHRKASLLPPNMALSALFDEFYHSRPFTKFWKTFKVFCNEDCSDFFQGQLPVKRFDKRTLNQVSDFFAESFEDILNMAQMERHHNSSLEDPSSHLPFIPWSQLHHIKPDSIQGALDDLGLDANMEEQYCGVLKSQREKFRFILFVNEELFGRQILEEYTCPGLYVDDMVLVRRTKMDKSLFCQNIKSFWTNYSDCALTRHPTNKHFYILESLPGVKARQLIQTGTCLRERLVAYFEQKWRQRNCLAEQRKQLQTVLGSHFKPSYNDFLVYIPAEDLDLSDVTYIGSGRYGKVFRIRWPKMPTGWHNNKPENFVVIKIMQSVCQSQPSYERQQTLLKELNVVYSALAGYNDDCVKFYGITRVAFKGDTDKTWRITDISNSTEGGELALVFEYASEGTIREFMERFLRPGAPLFNWTVICTLLADIIGGLRTIHARGIAHRDLHMNNVLVQARTIVSPAETETTYSALLADLGQGKIFAEDKLSATETSVKHLDQPEEEKSDIRAWAQMGIDLIRLFHDKLVDGNESILYPEKLMQILNDCVESEDEGGYSAILIRGMMGQIVDNLDADTGMLAPSLKWTGGNFQLPKVQARLSSSLRLTSTWLDS